MGNLLNTSTHTGTDANCFLDNGHGVLLQLDLTEVICPECPASREPSHWAEVRLLHVEQPAVVDGPATHTIFKITHCFFFQRFADRGQSYEQTAGTAGQFAYKD